MGNSACSLRSQQGISSPLRLRRAKLACGVLAGITLVLYVGVILIAHFRRPKAGAGGCASERQYIKASLAKY